MVSERGAGGRVVPRIEKIVYSTCSVHPEENEQVVAAALRSAEAIAGEFRLAPRSAVLPEWPRRGQPGNLDDAGWLLWLLWPPHGAHLSNCRQIHRSCLTVLTRGRFHERILCFVLYTPLWYTFECERSQS